MKTKLLILVISITSCTARITSNNENKTINTPNDLLMDTIMKKVEIKIPETNIIFHVDESKFKWYQETGDKIMEKCGFIPLQYSEFKDRILELYKVDLNNHKKDNYIVLDYYGIPNVDNEVIPESCVIIQSGRYINLSETMDPNGAEYDIMCNYNKMIFYNDLQATKWIKMNKPYKLSGIIIDYGYTGNEDWLQFIFNRLDVLNYDRMHDMLFGPHAKYINGKWKYVLRKNMADKMAEHNIELTIVGEIIERIMNPEGKYITGMDDYDKPVETIAYLLETSHRTGIYGHTEYLYIRHKEWRDTFRKHDYFGLEKLKHYSEKVFLPAPERDREDRKVDGYYDSCTINDPDGYTNVRERPDVNSPVLFVIKEGETFSVYVYPKEGNGNWYEVYRNDQVGYIHKSRVKLK